MKKTIKGMGGVLLLGSMLIGLSVPVHASDYQGEASITFNGYAADYQPPGGKPQVPGGTDGSLSVPPYGGIETAPGSSSGTGSGSGQFPMTNEVRESSMSWMGLGLIASTFVGWLLKRSRFDEV